MEAKPETLRIVPADWLHPLPLKELFGSDPARPLEVDVGSGKGRFLLARALAHPEVDFLGVDRMLRRIRKVDRKAIRAGLLNIRLLRVEAYYATAYFMPSDAISTYYIFFPDPWPKKRHAKRRLFTPEFARAAAAALSRGGLLRVATDNLPYFDAIREVLDAEPGLEKVPGSESGWSSGTDYERKYEKEGRPMARGIWLRPPLA